MDWNTVAAIAAVAAAAIVAWQSIETRRSAKASSAAAAAAVRAAETADAALQLAHAQRLDALKAQIDTGSPSVTVLVGEEPWELVEPGAYNTKYSSYTPVPHNHPDVLVLPRDAQRMFGLRVVVDVVNDSDRHVVVGLDKLEDDNGELAPSQVTLKPRSVRRFLCTEMRPLANWARGRGGNENSDAPEIGSSASITMGDPSDFGFEDHWAVMIDGTIAKPAGGGNGGAWTLVSGTAQAPDRDWAGLWFTARRYPRRYYRSKAEGVELV
jgi:hypothetical protein